MKWVEVSVDIFEFKKFGKSRSRLLSSIGRYEVNVLVSSIENLLGRLGFLSELQNFSFFKNEGSKLIVKLLVVSVSNFSLSSLFVKPKGKDLRALNLFS